MARQRIKRAEQDNHFARIPEDLLLVILSRIDDLKFLCQCSLVSKRFASTIYLIETVFLTLPNTEVPAPELVDDIDKLFPNIPSFTGEEIISLIHSSSLKWLKFLVFLQKFRQLKAISLEFTCREALCSSSLLNMKVKFSNSGAVVERLVSLVATSVFKDTEQEYDEENVPVTCRLGLTVGCCVEWLIVLSLLVKCLPSLESVVITNSKKQGKLVLRDNHLVAWRNNLFPGGFLDNLTPGTSKMGMVSKLQLPASGYVMKGVYFVIADVDPPSNSDSSTAGEDELTWEYVGEKKIFDEAYANISLLIQ